MNVNHRINQLGLSFNASTAKRALKKAAATRIEGVEGPGIGIE